MRQEVTKDDNISVVRASVSFPKVDYSKIEKMASNKRVSVAWVVREAVIEYLKKNEEAKSD